MDKFYYQNSPAIAFLKRKRIFKLNYGTYPDSDDFAYFDNIADVHAEMYTQRIVKNRDTWYNTSKDPGICCNDLFNLKALATCPNDFQAQTINRITNINNRR